MKQANKDEATRSHIRRKVGNCHFTLSIHFTSIHQANAVCLKKKKSIPLRGRKYISLRYISNITNNDEILSLQMPLNKTVILSMFIHCFNGLAILLNNIVLIVPLNTSYNTYLWGKRIWLFFPENNKYVWNYVCKIEWNAHLPFSYKQATNYDTTSWAK